jgi:ornithine cyclodeaminase
MNAPYWFGPVEVDALLDTAGCIAAVRSAMAALSTDRRTLPLRSITELGDGKLFGIMPGMMPDAEDFGAKLVGVFPDAQRPGRTRHHGAVTLLDGGSGTLRAVADAEAITRIRTAAASAVATDTLATADAARLAIYGCGVQAEAHIQAIAHVRALDWVGVWSRDHRVARRFAERMARLTGLCVEPVADGSELAGNADIICTVTGSPVPVLRGAWVSPGTHVNAVGSSYAGPVEVDHALVQRARYFVDYLPSALVAAAEFIAAREAGVIAEDHILGEIGAVISGAVPGRTGARDITFYKSLGHVVQDLAALRYIVERAGQNGALASAMRAP